MHKFKEVYGNLLDMFDERKFSVILHGCNAFHCMGGGIARQIAARYPMALLADKRTGYGDEKKMGTFSMADVTANNGTIVNMYTQYRHGTEKMQVDYDAVRSALRLVRLAFHGRKIGMPTVGAGLAGGDWAVIANIIDEELGDEDVTVVIFK